MKQAKRILVAGIFGALFSTSLWAATPGAVMPFGEYPRLNTINYQVTAEKWVSTQTAKVTVSIDASLNQAGMDNLQSQVESSLKSVANVDWRLVDFERTQDQSGLEKIHISAQARLATAQVTDIRTKTEKLSKPGLKYQIDSIDYTPTADDIQAAQASLRNELYQRIQAEIVALDKTFANQVYYVHDLNFGGDNNGSSGPMVRTMMLAAAPAQSAGNTSISQKVTVVANVTLASTIANPT